MTYKVTMEVEVDSGVYWPSHIRESAVWQDDHGYLLAYLEEVMGHVAGLRPVFIGSTPDSPDDVVDDDSIPYNHQSNQLEV